jgi:hypothetical protein
MAKEYASAYRNLLKKGTSTEEVQGVWRNKLNRDVGNGSTAHIA